MKNLTFNAKQEIYFITGNKHKVVQLSKYLKTSVVHHELNLVEIQSLSSEKVVEHKLVEAYKVINKPVLVDDNALYIKSLGGLPGAFIKYFGDEFGFENFYRLLKDFADKSALAEVVIGYYDGKNKKIFKGEVKGIIVPPTDGKNGFGWDKIFIPEAYSETRADMNDKDYDNTSPRRIALEKLEEFLK